MKKDSLKSSQDSNAKDNPNYPLQAVVISDASEKRFRPMTLERPRCLLPLANTPLLEYTLEFLAVSGVEETFVFISSFADEIKEYLQNSKWSQRNKSSMKVVPVFLPHFQDVGDVMREIDAKGLIQRDFILISGNVISNMKLATVFEEHKLRREVNKDAILTMVMKKANVHHRSRSVGETPLVAINPETMECVHYDFVKPRSKSSLLDVSLFDKHRSLKVYNDLIDCNIDICSVEVLALFTENFDYQDIRRDFVHGTLTSDILEKSIHVHLLYEDYAAKVDCTRLYDSITKDVLSRWTFPMVPDSNIYEGENFKYSRRNIYKGEHVVLSRSCELIENVLIGNGTEIGDNTILSNCTIGKNCMIGPNVVIEGAYLWDNVVIERGCSVFRSIISDFCQLKKNTVVNKGCLLSYNVVAGPDVSIPPFSKITTKQRKKSHVSCLTAALRETTINATESNDAELLGSEGRGRSWTTEWDADNDDTDEDSSEDNISDGLTLFGNKNAIMYQIGYENELFEVKSDEPDTDYSSDNQFDSEDEIDEEKQRDFHLKEIKETMLRTMDENHSHENAFLELNSLKMAFNISVHEVRKAMLEAMLSKISPGSKDSTITFGKLLDKWYPKLIKRFCPTENDVLDVLVITSDHFLNIEKGDITFTRILVAFWNSEIVDESLLRKFYEMDSYWNDDESSIKGNFKKNLSFVLQQIEEQSEEETEDDLE